METEPVITNECVESLVDEFDAITPTSEIISEVEPETEDETETEEDDLPEGCITPDPKTASLIHDVIAVAGEFKPLHKKLATIIEAHRAEIVLLKSKFGVRKGCAGSPMLIGKEAMTWEEFVVFYFDVSSRRLNQLLDVRDDKDTRLVTETPDSEKPLYKRGYDAAMAKVNPDGKATTQPAKQELQQETAKTQTLELRSTKLHLELVGLMDMVEKAGDRVPFPLTQYLRDLRKRLDALDANRGEKDDEGKK